MLLFRFVFLPENSTHIMQPLDVSVFGPMKKRWRTILNDWKEECTANGDNYASIPKQVRVPTVPTVPYLLERYRYCTCMGRHSMVGGGDCPVRVWYRRYRYLLTYLTYRYHTYCYSKKLNNSGFSRPAEKAPGEGFWASYPRWV